MYPWSNRCPNISIEVVVEKQCGDDYDTNINITKYNFMDGIIVGTILKFQGVFKTTDHPVYRRTRKSVIALEISVERLPSVSVAPLFSFIWNNDFRSGSGGIERKVVITPRRDDVAPIFRCRLNYDTPEGAWNFLWERVCVFIVPHTNRGGHPEK